MDAKRYTAPIRLPNPTLMAITWSRGEREIQHGRERLEMFVIEAEQVRVMRRGEYRKESFYDGT